MTATEHRFFESELHRVKGNLLLISGEAASEVEACYRKALEVAGRQQAKSYELRAAMSLGRLWRDQGKHNEAHELVSEIYGWFTEGFETRDLMEAKVLLDGLTPA